MAAPWTRTDWRARSRTLGSSWAPSKCPRCGANSPRRPRQTLEPIVDLATDPRRYVTVSALAAYLDCDARTVRRMIHAGALPAIRVGRHWRIRVVEARQVLRSVGS